MSKCRVLPIVLSFVAMAGYQPQLIAQQYDSDLFNEMRWRMIGPFRGGRTKAAAGIPNQPNVFYMGVVNGGVWKTTDVPRHAARSGEPSLLGDRLARSHLWPQPYLILL